MTVSKKLIVILVLFAMATVAGVYDNYLRKPQQKYIEPNVTVCHSHSVYR